MPGAVNNTLYPPVVSTFMPAFVNTETAVIYFSLSPYNNVNDVKRVHVTLQNQTNNENAMLNKPSGILIESLNFDSEIGLYYVTIPPAVVGGSFSVNQFYKVQIRFDCNINGPDLSSIEQGTGTDSSEKAIYSYVLNNTNLTYFSEWSSICLIRPILQPYLMMNNLQEDTAAIYNKGIIPIAGQLIFGSEQDDAFETETLSSYNIQVIDTKQDVVVMKTPEIYTGNSLNPNGINYKLDLQGLDTSATTDFTLRININTANQYYKSYDFPITIADFLDDESYNPQITIKDQNEKGVVTNEDGVATIHVYNSAPIFGTLYVKRASSLENFTVWEDIWVDNVAGPIDMDIIDNTVGSLVWYQYSVQLENERGALTTVKRSRKFMPDFYDAIFSRAGQQLRIQYNYRVSSMKPTVNRSKVDTLGGKYPKFVENAVLNYKQFSISGTLSAMNDENELFLAQKDYFTSEEFQNFLIYNREDEGHISYPVAELGDGITQEAHDRNDYFWEREFREAAVAWLNDGEPKLYRSMTEGAMVVMLTDVSLTPNATLSRRVWDFTATMYEVAEADSLQTLDTLGIYTTHKIPESTKRGGIVLPDSPLMEESKPGQLYNFTILPTDNAGSHNKLRDLVMDRLKDYYSGYLSNLMPDDITFSNVKIYFQSKPHAYYITKEGTITSNEDVKGIPQIGYLIQIETRSANAVPVFVNQRGFYQVPEELEVRDIEFMDIGDMVTVEFVMTYQVKQNPEIIVSGTSLDKTVVGQEIGVFEPNVWLGNEVRAKYNFYQPEIITNNVKTLAYSQKMSQFTSLILETEPQAVIELIYDDHPDDRYEYVIGASGKLRLVEDYIIKDIRFMGRRLSKRNFKTGADELLKYQLDSWEFAEDKIEYADIADIKQLQNNFIYNINGNKQIYYKQHWYDFEYEDGATDIIIVKAPIEALINFTGNIIKYTF